MSYFLLSIPFLVFTVLLVLLSLRKPGAKRRLLFSTLTALVLVVLTAIFDNVMIASGLVGYPKGASSGLRIGVAPLEDFLYPLVIAFAMPALGALLPSSWNRPVSDERSSQ